MKDLKHQDKTHEILKAFYRVYNTLGYGFLEKVYENAMMLELKEMGFRCRQQCPIKVYYKEQRVGEYYADIIVDDAVIVELKAASTIAEPHEYQLLNYLKATEIEVGLLLNFGQTPEFKRKVFSNEKNRKDN